MADRNSIMNALIELECKPTTYCRELLRKKYVEALTTAEFDPCDRLDGRTARKELSLYDAMLAEIMDERNAEKARVRNRRRADRKHKLTPKMRKEQEWMRNRNICMKMVDFGTWDDIPIVEGRVRSADKIARADYQTELRNIAEDDERMKVEAEVREWERKQAVEQANRRAWMMMQDWLEWA